MCRLNLSTAERRAWFAAEWPAVERRLSLRGVLGEQGQKELVRLLALTACGLKEAAEHAMVLQALIGAGTLNDPSHDDQRAQAALGLIIGGRYVRTTKAGKEELLLRPR